MQLKPYWLDSAPAFTGGRDDALPSSADVVVIGGGFSGLSAARALARRGADVVVLEAGGVVSAASGRNGGHCNNGLAKGITGVAAAYGQARAEDLYKAFDAAVDTVERVVGEEHIDCDFRRSGKVQVAAKPSHYARLVDNHAVLARGVDPDTELIPPEKLRSEVNSELFHGGLLYRRGAMLHVGRFGIGLAEAAAHHGAAIFENTPVTNLKRLAGDRHEVATAKGTIRADKVFLATGADTGSAFPFFRRRIAPIGSFIIATEPLAVEKVDEIMPTRRTAVTTKNIGNYFRISPDNRVIFGGRARFALSNPTSDAKSGQILMRGLCDVFPSLSETKIDYCWGGLLDVTQDRLPRAGKQDGVYYAMGYSGHGVQMSVHMGTIMAAILSGEDNANPLEGLPWPAMPSVFGKPWFLPIVGAYYRLLDKLS